MRGGYGASGPPLVIPEPPPGGVAGRSGEGSSSVRGTPGVSVIGSPCGGVAASGGVAVSGGVAGSGGVAVSGGGAASGGVTGRPCLSYSVGAPVCAPPADC